MNSKINCAVIKDLLPLYHDDVVCEETKAIIEEHLMQCEDCSNKYELLSSELPMESKAPSTQNLFIKMMKRKKTRQIILTIFCVVLSCIFLVSAYSVQSQYLTVNVPNDEITVEKVFRYETEEGLNFFVMYSTYNYANSGCIHKVENGDTLVFNCVKPIISSKEEEKELYFIMIDGTHQKRDDGEKIFDDIKTVKVGDEVVWTAETNANDVVPDYVYVYDEFERMEFSANDWAWDYEAGWLAAIYYDGTMTKWDFDGNVLVDTHIKED